MANLFSLILPLVFTFAVAAWGPLSTRNQDPLATDEVRGNRHRPPARK